MSGFESWPAPILRRWLLSAAAGPVIFLIGLTGRIALRDPVLLPLSALLSGCIITRCILLFRTIRQGDYETVEGVCIAIRWAPIGGHQRIRLMDDSGSAHDLLLDRRQKFLIGSSYRVSRGYNSNNDKYQATRNSPKLNMIQTSQLILLDAFLSSKLNWGCG